MHEGRIGYGAHGDVARAHEQSGQGEGARDISCPWDRYGLGHQFHDLYVAADAGVFQRVDHAETVEVLCLFDRVLLHGGRLEQGIPDREAQRSRLER